MLGIVDVGGGMRCIYSAGVYDCFYDRKIDVGYCLGVSAGSANLISYVCGQRGRNLAFYSDYALRKEYMSAENFIKTRISDLTTFSPPFATRTANIRLTMSILSKAVLFTERRQQGQATEQVFFLKTKT